MKYKKQSTDSHAWVLGMLHLVTVKLVRKTTKEIITHKLLVVADSAPSIEQKLNWIFDQSEYSEMKIKSIDKIKEKIHFLSTTIIQPSDIGTPLIERKESTFEVIQNKTEIEKYDPKLYAIGITTTMLAKDEMHALRKFGHAVIASVSEGNSHSGAALSENSTIKVEEISKSSGYAKPRDVSAESNQASFVRG